MFTTTKTASAIKLALLGGAATIALSSPVFAQEEDDAQDIEKISVTGSRIQSVNVESTSPVVTIDSELFDIRGTTDTVDLLNTLPSFFAAQTTAFANGATGTSTADLRGLGSQRTLVLVDGKRMPPGGPLGGWASDLNLIAPQLIERVDVVTGGASAVYGSDAIAGVVNFITRKDFQGVEVDVQYGFNQSDNSTGFFQEALRDVGENPQNGSATGNDTIQISLLMGAGTDDGRGNFTVYGNYSYNEGLQQSERDFAQCATFPVGENELVCLGSNQGPFPTTFVIDGAGLSLGANDELNPGFTNAYNFNPFNPIRRETERFNIGFNGYYDINDDLKAYADFGFTSSSSPQIIAPSAAFGSTINRINCDNPVISDSLRNSVCGSTDIAGPWPRADEDGYGQAQVRRRFVEGGGRTDTRNRTNFRSVVGLEGVIDDKLDWDIFAQYSETRLTRVQTNQVTLEPLQNALDIVTDPATGQPACRVAVNGTDAACVPFVTAYSTTAEFDQALVSYLDTPTITIGTGTQTIFGGSLSGNSEDYNFSSPLAEEGIGFLIGFEARRDELFQQADGIAASGDLVGSGGATVPVNGETTVFDVFTELSIPLISGMEGIEQLNMTVAYRHSEYESTNNLLRIDGDDLSTDTYAFGMSYVPFDDLRIRAQLQRAVRAPNVLELFSPQNSNLTSLSDPCSGLAPTASQAACANTGLGSNLYGSVPPDSGQLNILVGGNPNLNPETSDTFTLGAVYEPSFVDNLTLSIDYFDIVVEDAIGTIPTSTTLNQCLTTGNATFCDNITRGPDGSLTFFPREQAFIQAGNVNVAEFGTNGFDLQANYRLSLSDVGLDNLGDVSFNYNATYLLGLEFIDLPGTASYNCVGFYAEACGNPNAKYRHNAVMSWTTPMDITASLVWRHISAVEQVGVVGNGFVADGATGSIATVTDLGGSAIDEEIEAVNYFDLTVFYDFSESITFRAGINNILDEDPPVVTTFGVSGVNVEANTVAGVYDAAGRFVFFGASMTF